MQGLLPIFFALLLSWSLFRLNYVKADIIPALSNYVLRIALPFLIFANFVNAPPNRLIDAPIMLAFAIPSIALYGAYFWLGRARNYLPNQAMIFGHGAVAGNSMLLGIPVLYPVFGNEINASIAQIILFENILLTPFFISVTDYFEGNAKGVGMLIKSIVINPFLIEMTFALAVPLLSGSLPHSIANMTEFIAASATPVAIFVIGGILAQTRFRGHAVEASIISLGKLLLLPALVFLFATLLNIDTQNRIVLKLFSAMPQATIFPIFGKKVAFETLAGSIFLITYFGACFTLIGWLYVFGAA